MTVDISTLADNAYHRQVETAQYQANINNYTQMLTTLPTGEWPEELLQYHGTPAQNLPVTVDLATMMQVANLQLRDDITMRIRAEMVQQNIANQAGLSMQAQIPADQLAQAMADAQTRYATMIVSASP